MAIQVFTDYQMNANRVRNASDATLAQDYVTLAQLQAAIASVNGFSATFGDGLATTYAIVHNLNTLDVVVAVQEVATGDLVEVGLSTSGVNGLDITMTPAPAVNAYRITILPRA
jgi:hypothetical protein